jgi:hypothetical protein
MASEDRAEPGTKGEIHELKSKIKDSAEFLDYADKLARGDLGIVQAEPLNPRVPSIKELSKQENRPTKKELNLLVQVLAAVLKVESPTIEQVDEAIKVRGLLPGKTLSEEDLNFLKDRVLKLKIHPALRPSENEL